MPIQIIKITEVWVVNSHATKCISTYNKVNITLAMLYVKSAFSYRIS